MCLNYIGEKNIEKFLGGNLIGYINFDQKTEPYINHMEHNWEDQGYYILSNIDQKGVDIFHHEQEYILNLTSNKSKSNLDSRMIMMFLTLSQLGTQLLAISSR
jgi:nitroimidazol reductase NimA-like FMN-containing flavoprotein (pyridoxamine 5'-phosphate oxidase superfamily)